METRLTNGIKAGNRTMFNEVFSLYWHRLVGFTRLILDDDSAQDVVQSVFLKVWDTHESFPVSDDSGILPYLMRAVHNSALNVLRSKDISDSYKTWYAKKIEYEYALSIHPDNNETIRKLYIDQTREEIDSIIDSLPGKCKTVFKLRYYDGFSAQEVAEMLDISVSTVNNQVFKALTLLRSKLSLMTFLVCFDILCK